MDRLTFVLFGIEALIPLFVVLVIYQSARWDWKARPYIPLLLGILLLAGGFGFYIWLTSEAEDAKAILAQGANILNPDELQFLRSNMRAKELAAKLGELFTIPVAVSLIVAGLLSKTDKEFNRMLKRYEAHRILITSLQEQHKALSAEFELSLDRNVRGPALMDQWNKLKALREDMTFERLEFRERFRSFRNSQDDD